MKEACTTTLVQQAGSQSWSRAKATYDAFRQLLGELHDESYVYVEEVNADAYGYGGQTQERCYIQSKLERAESRADHGS